MADRMERVGPYKLVKKLGEGSSGKVKLGVHTETGQEVAIKILDKNKLISDAKLLRRVEREIAVMRLIRHPNVLRLYDVFQSEAHLFLILEYVDGGELYGYVQKRGQLTVDEAFHFFSQLLSGLRYCHNNLICHRDLKLENLLLDKNRNLKIADFGMASLMPEGQLLATSCGSPHYASPEVVKGDKYNGFASDVWSCGVILYALTTGRLPFDADALPRLLLKVKRGKFAMPSNMDPDLQDLIKCMLAYDPANRIPPRLISKHPWYEKTLESVKETPEGLQPWHQELPEKDTVTYQMQLYRLAQDHLGSEESVNAEEIAAEDSLVGGEDFSLGRVFETEDEEETFRKFAAPIEDQDQEALITIASLLGGSSTVAEIQEQLREDVPNVEKVIYKLLLDRRDQDGKIDIDTEPPLKKVEEPGSRRGPSPPAGSSGSH